ncbi:U-box domain-containing 35-like [Olea europaea subsp. europaea]|uniref:RING-type E3 ubiquitin transferase n=1 Tax=Olea europaea subsp. europaea TaxID=158383 RepID=A0A8S0Q499_OLEEU|nr:U-box domain-containing 35-like [Olea europaea subsp. europaea]
MHLAKALELRRWKVEEQQRLEEARMAEDAALAIAKKEKAKCKVALEKAEAAQTITEFEVQKRIDAEIKALKESEKKRKVLDEMVHNDESSEYYSTSQYGSTPWSMPEYVCLAYEYMANGRLDDRLSHRENTWVLPWQLKFRVAAEISTSLHFLHQAKPEPPVYRDLKLGSILLDCNFVMVPDWPVEEALKFAKLALKCKKLRCKDRLDLHNVVLPELNRLRALAEETMTNITRNSHRPPQRSHCSAQVS